jgi:DNA-binding transcriptional LysR family regulator
MREENLDQIQRELTGGVIELALLYELDIVDDVRRIELANFAPYALLPKGHPLEGEATVSLVDLAASPFVLIDLPHSRDYFLSLFRMVDVMPSQVIRCTSLETLRGMVAHGMGVSVLVTRPHDDRSYDGRPLVCRPLTEKVPPHRAIICSSAHAPMTRAAEAFVEVTRQYFKKLPANAALA